MSVTISCENKIVTAYIAGDIDHHSAKNMREKIDLAIDSYSPDLLIMDFKDVMFMDSSGIGLIMGQYKLMESSGGRVKVTNMSKGIARVMQLAGLNKLGII